MPRFTTDGRRSVTSTRLDSDAETLPFPEGGVFGKPRFDGGGGAVRGEEIAQELDHVLDRMQQQLDSIKSDVMRIPLTDSWPPRAA